jgi:hypothetical protein
MNRIIFMLDRTSGRIVTVRGAGEDWATYSFLPSFNSLRLARVHFTGLTHSGQLGQINMWHSHGVVRAGVYKFLGMDCECRYALNRILSQLPRSVRASVEA